VARLQQQVRLIGAAGADAFGDELIRHLQNDGVEVQSILRRNQAPTGMAFIVVDQAGQNQIVVASGANSTLTAAEVETESALICGSQALLTQLEVPLPAVAMGLRLAHEAGVLTVLNPAPFTWVPDEVLRCCDWIVPNEIEAAQLTQLPVAGPAQAAVAARSLRERSRGAGVALTLGSAGVWVECDSFSGQVPAFSVEAVDTVAAGDAFIGAFVSSLIEGQGPREAARFGNAAAALAVTRRGAQASLPRREEVLKYLDLKTAGRAPRESAQSGV
jgi:ribokinase